jgi:hypothetical protein
MDTTYSTVVWHYTYHVVHSQRHRRTLSANCHIHDCLGKKIHSSFSAVQTPTPPPHPPACSDAAEATTASTTAVTPTVVTVMAGPPPPPATRADERAKTPQPPASYVSPLKKLRKTMSRHERRVIDTIDGECAVAATATVRWCANRAGATTEVCGTSSRTTT